jgi:hypothetical protein
MADIIPASPAFVFEFNDAFRIPASFARAAMQRHSWTNNRQPVFSVGLAGPLYANGV